MDWPYLYFQPQEFACHCCGVIKMEPCFLSLLDRARGLAGVPFVINSGYRCPDHDRAIGGRGVHTQGLAADIATPDSGTRYKVMWALTVGFRRIGVGKNFIHVDLAHDRAQNVMWTYY